MKDHFPKENAYAQFLSKRKSLEESMEMARAVSYPWLQGEILMQMSSGATWAGDLERSMRFTQAGLEISEQIGDWMNGARLLWEQGSLSFMQGRLSLAAQLYQRCRDYFEAGGDMEFGLFALRFSAWLALAQGQYADAMQLSQIQLERSQEWNVPWVLSDALGGAAWAALAMGAEAMAQEYALKALELREQTSEDLLAVARYVLARLALRHGNHDQARTYLNDFLLHNALGFPHVLLGIQLVGMLSLAEGQPQHAARLFGAQAALAPCLMNVIPPPEREEYQRALTSLRSQLSPEDFCAAWGEGQALSTVQAIDGALTEL